MLTPDQFTVNEAWVVVKVSESPLNIQGEPHDVYVLMDAASTYIMGHVIVSAVKDSVSKKEVESALKESYKLNNQWPDQLIVTGDSEIENAFVGEVEKKNIKVKKVQLSELKPIVGSAIDLFSAQFKVGP